MPVVHVDWRPPAHGDVHLAELLSRLDERREQIERANAEAFARLTSGEAVLVDCRPAREAFGLPTHLVLHAGPPIAWAAMCEPMQAAVLCAIRYEGWAADDDAAARLIERQEVHLAPCHHWGAVGPMTGIITASMPVFVVENRRLRQPCLCDNQRRIGQGLDGSAPTMHQSSLACFGSLPERGHCSARPLRASGGIDLRTLMAQALRMGDEMHQRNIAASALLARALMPHLARAAADTSTLTAVAEFMAGNDQFFLNLGHGSWQSVDRPRQRQSHIPRW